MISVIIPTYKRSKYISRAVESVFLQTYKDIEVIVVDDNGQGQDEQLLTAEKILELQKKYNIQYIPHEKNRGGCAARNTGIKYAKGEYVALLDDDDCWFPEFLEKLLSKMANPKVGAVYSKYYVRMDGKVYDMPHLQVMKRGNVYNDLISGWCVTSTSFFLLRKSFVDMVNGFDENLQSFQDYDMWVRMSRVCEFDYCDDHLVIKENGHSDDQVSMNPIRRQAGLDVLNQKMLKDLCVEDYKLFEPFIRKWEKTILYTKLIIAHKNKQKEEFRDLYKQYKKLESHKIKLAEVFVYVLFGSKRAGGIRKIALMTTGKMRRIRDCE